METPLIVTLARQISVKDEMDAIANNIANMSTGAYKGERVMFRDYLARTSTGDKVVFPQESGIYRVNRPGPLDRTSNPLDVAIQGEGYFEVQTPSGFRYTRNGHFRLDSQGQLVTGDGQPVMTDSRRPLVFDSSVQKITIANDGTVSADDNQVGKLKLVTFDNLQGLERRGGGLYKATTAPKPVKDVEIRQGYLEGSNIQPILEMTRFMRASGEYQHAQKIITEEHDRQRRAIQTLGSLPQ